MHFRAGVTEGDFFFFFFEVVDCNFGPILPFVVQLAASTDTYQYVSLMFWPVVSHYGASVLGHA